ncbi:MAG TPA: prepilin-type N-terminal cleavage/methylation domain-containing protein [Candidatus Acidoferrales bacterium]|nr:prepilin-type N-terminal cleavage/methylation domain-containing protein [Candidatus Acidoferrales bacterium]
MMIHKSPTSRTRRLGRSGFSMIELLVVISITAILTAFAIPQLMNVVYASRMRGAANGLAGLVQQTRMLAEQQNKSIPVVAGSLGSNATGAFIGLNGTTWQAGNPSVAYSTGVSNGSAGSVPTALSPGFTAVAAGTTLYFNWRGAPVTSSGAYMSPKGVIFYITDTHNNWAAVSVSGAGRSKVWVFNGTSWR